MISGITLISLSLLFPFIRGMQDAYVEINKKVSHKINTALVIVISLFAAIMTFNNSLLMDKWEYLQVFLSMLFIYWFVFDGTKNKFTPNRPFFYVGTTSTLDIWQRKFAPLFWFKIIMFPISLFILTQFLIR